MASTKKTRHGKLVRGTSYTLQGKVFLRNKWVEITDGEHAHLAEVAFDMVSIKDGDETTSEKRHKFVFEPREAVPAKKPVRSRTRS